ncbi:MAG: M23 family metallopeptidase [Tepidisphaeraceae bacterium]
MKLAILFALLTAYSSFAQSTAPANPADLASRLDAAFLSGNTQLLWDAASPELRKVIGSPEALAALRTKALGANPHPVAQSSTLTRTVRTATGQHYTIQYAVDESGTLAGLLIQPAAATTEAPTTFLKYKTKAALRLPFTETWTVAWGGRTVKQNYHAAYPDQRFAYDLLIKKDNSSHAGEGKRNEDYYCYNQPVLSPAIATVADAVDDVPDNTPGEMNPAKAMGNYVVLQLGTAEYLFLCHFKPGTLKVKKGDKVTRGQELALCGNSGNSSEPHLHLHLQTTPVPFKGQGLPCQFQDYTADNTPIERGEPTHNQQIRPQ